MNKVKKVIHFICIILFIIILFLLSVKSFSKYHKLMICVAVICALCIFDMLSFDMLEFSVKILIFIGLLVFVMSPFIRSKYYPNIIEQTGKLATNIIIIMFGVYLFKKRTYTNSQKDSYSLLGCLMIIIGLTYGIASIFNITKNTIKLWENWGFEEKSAITVLSLIISIITLITGNLVKLKINNDNNRKDRLIKMHSEINWRKELHNLEIQNEYTIQDLVKLNSFINPKHNIKDKNNIDVIINREIVNILKEHDCILNDDKEVKTSIITKIKNIITKIIRKIKNIITKIIRKIITKIKTKVKNKGKGNKTLFDFILYKTDLEKKLTSKENQKIRECIHNLLKEDWKIQTR